MGGERREKREKRKEKNEKREIGGWQMNNEKRGMKNGKLGGKGV